MRTMFKACPRCAGDVRESSDIYGNYLSCVQCGHSVDIPEPQSVSVRVASQVIEHKDAA
jgi:hypothetical protein